MFLTMSLVFNTQFHIGKENIKTGLHKHHHYNTLCKQSLKNPLRYPALPGASDPRLTGQNQNIPCLLAVMLASWMRGTKRAFSPWESLQASQWRLCGTAPVGEKNSASLFIITWVPENTQALENEVSLTLLFFHFSVFLPPCILQCSPSPSPACRPAQDLLSYRTGLGRLSCGSSMMYMSKGATRTAQVTWKQTKL